MAERCGSYPLMNLAADYGVDYGDVLLWADFMRRARADNDGLSSDRWDSACQAYVRILVGISSTRKRELERRLTAHADARWGSL